jgi:type III secretion protein J
MRARKEFGLRWVFGAAALALLGCQGTLQAGLEEHEANEVLVVLAQHGLAGSKVGGGRAGHAVEVASDDLAAAWSALRAAGLPRPRHAGFRDVFQERGLVPGQAEEQALFLSALQEELARTLEAVEGVLAARVHVAGQRLEGLHLRPGGGPGGERRAAPSAAVLLAVQRLDPLPIGPEEVRALLAHAVEGLEPERVSVVCVPRASGPGLVRSGDRPPGGGIVFRSLAVLVAGLSALGLGWFFWRGTRRAPRVGEEVSP